MMELEVMDLYEGPELSLFGGDELILRGLSPLGHEGDGDLFPAVTMATGDGKQTAGAGMLVKEASLSITELVSTNYASLLKEDSFVTSSNITSTPQQSSFPTDGNATSLDMGWLDTKLDLFDLVGEVQSPVTNSDEHQLVFFDDQSTFVASPGEGAVPQSPTIIPVPAANEPSAEDILNEITGLTSANGAVTSQEPENGQLFLDVLNKLTSDICVKPEENPTLYTPPDGVLSPVSVDDIESLLSGPVSPVSSGYNPADSFIPSGVESVPSSCPVSPQASSSVNCTDSDPDYSPTGEESLVLKKTSTAGRPSRKRKTPYSRNSPTDKKERKKEQNKTAALKYRQKKKEESMTLDEQCAELETKNKSLKDKVESMTREIQYLKDLMAEVIKAKTSKGTT